MNKTKEPDDEAKKQIRLIHALAVRLPWIVVAVTLLTALATMIEVVFLR
jgi:hypothetical protein